MGGKSDGVPVALDVGVVLGGAGEPDGVAETVDSGEGETVALPGVGSGEAVKPTVGDGLALPGDGVGDGVAVRLAVGDGLALPGDGVGDGEAVKPTVGDGLALPVGGLGVSVVGIAVSVPGGVSDGPGPGEVASARVNTGMPKEPSADEARGKERNNKSPTSDRAPAGLNRGTLTLSS